MSVSTPLLLTILGPTASGKTTLAAHVAAQVEGEIISADSRQVYRGMDIGTGKDLADYSVVDPLSHTVHTIPYHLIDIRNAGEEYNIYQFQNEFIESFNAIVDRGHLPILCGGSGMYIESVVGDYKLPDAPINAAFRKECENQTDEELTQRLSSLISLHNHTDTDDRARLLRALEIQEYKLINPDSYTHMPPMRTLLVGVRFPREELIKRIGVRLRNRLEEGMIDEVNSLILSGVDPSRLKRYGLEYKRVTQYLLHELTYEQMFEKLYTDIRQFSKRQMTWFRRMERNGLNICWIDGMNSLDEKVNVVLKLIDEQNNQ